MEASEESEELGPRDEIVTLEVEVPADHVKVKKKLDSHTEETQPEQPKPEDIKREKGEEDGSSINIGGKSLDEFLKSPVETLPLDTSPDEPKTTQKEVIVIGVIVIVLAFLAWPIFNFATALSMVFAGMFLIIGGMFVHV
jgi:hypothetical protein